jgi:hypothetical protein
MTDNSWVNPLNNLVLRKLRERRAWHRIFIERLTEPLHINLLSASVALFGSLRAKIDHDLIVRPHNAFAILKAADYAKQLGLRCVSILEFGVATGAGLMNMARIAESVTKGTGIEFRIYGFDTGRGMPPPTDYRDHPDLYAAGDFAMNPAALRKALPENVELILGDVAKTVPTFLRSLPADSPIGYAVIDVDYYSSTTAALSVFADSDPAKYLPITLAFFDDITRERHNSWCGELLAIREFNERHERRKLEAHAPLRNLRIYRRAAWLEQIRFLHVLDHPNRLTTSYVGNRTLLNPYLD